MQDTFNVKILNMDKARAGLLIDNKQKPLRYKICHNKTMPLNTIKVVIFGYFFYSSKAVLLYSERCMEGVTIATDKH